MKSYVKTLFVLTILIIPSWAFPVTIAYLDFGIDVTHPALRDHLWENEGEIEDGEDNDGNGITDDIHGVSWIDKTGTLYDDHPDGHGTHIAGILLGLHESWPRNQDIKLLSFKINLDDPGMSLLKSLEYAEAQGVFLFHLSYVQPDIPIHLTECRANWQRA